jgi:hypothetical protein
MQVAYSKSDESQCIILLSVSFCLKDLSVWNVAYLPKHIQKKILSPLLEFPNLKISFIFFFCSHIS